MLFIHIPCYKYIYYYRLAYFTERDNNILGAYYFVRISIHYDISLPNLDTLNKFNVYHFDLKWCVLYLNAVVSLVRTRKCNLTCTVITMIVVQ